MKIGHALATATLILAACSETPIEERGEEAIAEMESQIEKDARSLEEAADESVKALEKDIDSQLADDGIGGPEPKQLPNRQAN
ncbi:MAG: hypothetical protein WBM39_11760 [Parasphingorhabdus sp.]